MSQRTRERARTPQLTRETGKTRRVRFSDPVGIGGDSVPFRSGTHPLQEILLVNSLPAHEAKKIRMVTDVCESEENSKNELLAKT